MPSIPDDFSSDNKSRAAATLGDSISEVAEMNSSPTTLSQLSDPNKCLTREGQAFVLLNLASVVCYLDGETHGHPADRILDVNVRAKPNEPRPLLELGKVGWVLSREERLSLFDDVRQVVGCLRDGADVHHYMASPIR
jgi:hypothetical protein